MAEYLVNGEKLTAIGDAIRSKTGGTEELTLEQMATQINALEVGGSNATVGDFTYTEESGDEPETYNYVLTSDSLQSSTRSMITIFNRINDSYSCVWKTLFRASLSDSFETYEGTKDHITQGMTITISENSISVTGAMNVATQFDGFWFIAY